MGKEGEAKGCTGRQLSVQWKGGLIREKVFWARQGWQNSEMPLFISLLFNLISCWRHISTLCSLQRVETAVCFPFCPHHPPTEQSLLIFMPLTPASIPLSQPLPNSTEVLLASPQWICVWFPPQPRKITLSEHTAPASAPSRTLQGHFPTQASWQHETPVIAGAGGCKLSPPAALHPASPGEAEISLLPSPPGLCSARGHASAGAYLSIRTLFKTPSLGQDISILLWLGQRSCGWYK